MEAASAGMNSPLMRDGAVPGAPSVRAAAAGRHPIDGVVRCGCCGRFPLVGERVTRHADSGEWACDACEHEGRGGKLGPVLQQDRVRSLGGAMNVRRAA